MRTRIRRLILLAASVLCCAHASVSQEKCELDRSIAPDYGGVMLGMGLDELKRMFPASQDLQSASAATSGGEVFNASLGVLELYIRKDAFKGVEELSLALIGGKVHRIDVSFRAPTPWTSVTEFSEHMSKQLALPAASWGSPISDATKQAQIMECRGFAVVVRAEKGGASSLSIVDTTSGEKDRGHASPRAGNR
jgi:hypothetical protein